MIVEILSMAVRTTLLKRMGLSAALVIVSSSMAFGAGAPLNTAGFENYTAGALTPVYPNNLPHMGQQGWVGIDQAGTTTNVQNAVVQSSIVQSGSKALRVSRAASVDNRWTVLFGANSGPGALSVTLPQNQITLPSHRFVLIDWDMRVADAEGDGLGELGPFFGMEAWDGSKYPDTPKLLGSLGVDASTGQVVYQNPTLGRITNTGRVVSFDVWNHFALLLDYSIDKYTMFLNGTAIVAENTAVAPQSFVDGSFGLDHFTDADIAALSIYDNSASNGMAGTAYYDNFRVLDGVPADFDFDGDVDAGDLTSWRGAVGPSAVGDADGDGDSDGADFLIWQNNKGADFTPATAVGLPVPEPASWCLAVAAGVALGACRGRKRR